MKNSIVNNSLVDQIYHVLKDSIIKGELDAGDRIVEMKIAKTYGVSQGIVREALSQLQNEGLVIKHRHKGTFVSNVSEKDFQEMLDLRELIETFALKRAIEKFDEDDFKNLEAYIKEMELAAKENDSEKISKIDKEFHNIIFKKANHKLLMETWESLSVKYNRIWYFTKRVYFSDLSQVADIHRPIVNALKKRDLEEVIKEFQHHLNFSRKELNKFK